MAHTVTASYGSSYQADPNDPTKQIPNALPDNAYDRAAKPAMNTLTKTPNAVMVGASNGTIGFFFGSSASFAAKATTEGGATLTGSAHYESFGTPNEGTVLNIHPMAWSGSATDSVTFIYKSGLSTGGF
jgi:hypothetical protein